MWDLIKKIRPFQIIITIIIVFLSVENVFLILQNKQLKSVVRNLSGDYNSSLKPGDKLKPIDVMELTGEIKNIKFNLGTRKNLLFLFSTNCPHCEKNLPYWESLRNSIDSSLCGITIISKNDSEATIDWLQKNKVNFDVSVNKDTSFKIFVVPQTILTDKTGIIENIWLGELNSSIVKSIQNMIKSSSKRAS